MKKFDPYLHTLEAALNNLGESPAYDAVLTWDGGDNYRVQAGEQYLPYDDGFAPILSRVDLQHWYGLQHWDGEPPYNVGEDAATLEWVSQNQQVWFDDEASAPTARNRDVRA